MVDFSIEVIFYFCRFGPGLSTLNCWLSMLIMAQFLFDLLLDFGHILRSTVTVDFVPISWITVTQQSMADYINLTFTHSTRNLFSSWFSYVKFGRTFFVIVLNKLQTKLVISEL